MDIHGIVTIRFQRLSAQSRSNADGLYLPYGCGGKGPENGCEQSPVLLLTSNIEERAACADHVAAILNALIDGILRSHNGERGCGFLRRPAPVQTASPPPSSLTATDDIVWQTRLDGRYDVVVLRATRAYAGVLVIYDGPTEILRTDVGLAYNAVVGPDAADVQEWMQTTITFVDSAKSPPEIMSEAIYRIEAERRSRIAELRASAHAAEAYALAFDLYRSAERSVEWLISASVLLNGKAPVDVLNETDGLELVKGALGELAQTLYPLF